MSAARSTATPRQRRGAAGESAALAHLQGAGLILLARNVRCRYGELDLVMLDGATLVFVEVRTRADGARGGALGSVGSGKRLRLLRAAADYLASHPAHAARTCRFDVVGYDGHAPGTPCQWVRAAFEAG